MRQERIAGRTWEENHGNNGEGAEVDVPMPLRKRKEADVPIGRRMSIQLNLRMEGMELFAKSHSRLTKEGVMATTKLGGGRQRRQPILILLLLLMMMGGDEAKGGGRIGRTT
jgi:hypothetical protein